jgi:hypothetical protein
LILVESIRPWINIGTAARARRFHRMRSVPHTIRARALAVEAAKGVAVGLILGLALIVFDAGHLRTLVLASEAPALNAAIVIVGAAIAFVPVVITVVLGLPWERQARAAGWG